MLFLLDMGPFRPLNAFLINKINSNPSYMLLYLKINLI